MSYSFQSKNRFGALGCILSGFALSVLAFASPVQAQTTNTRPVDTTRPAISKIQDIVVNSDSNTCGATVRFSRPAVTDNAPDCSFEALTAKGFSFLGNFGSHSYYLTPQFGSWTMADSFAKNVGGYLVTLNTAAENEFVFNAVADRQIVWLGLTDRDTEGVWKWSNGEPVTYQNWCDGQPDDWSTGQDYAIMNSGGLTGSVGCWDDAHNSYVAAIGAYNTFKGIVELNSCTTSLVRTAGLDSGSFFPIGTTVVSFKATDASGNVNTTSFKVTVLDKYAPTLVCPADISIPLFAKTSPSNTGTATATDCGTAIVSYSDSCSLSLSSTWYIQIGYEIYRKWTATDAAGNKTSSVQRILVGIKCNSNISVNVSDQTYTGGVPTNIYLGYGAQQAVLTANSDGSGLTYLWTGPTSALSATTTKNPVFTPKAAGTYPYVVAVRNNTGCTSYSTVTFVVKDIRVKNQENKVYICHAAANGKRQTTAVAVSAVEGHLKNHDDDVLGSCDAVCSNNARMIYQSDNESATEVKVYPNPTSSNIFVEVPRFENNATIRVMDVQGRIIQQRQLNSGAEQKQHFDLSGNIPGMYLIDVTYDDQKFLGKIMLN